MHSTARLKPRRSLGAAADPKVAVSSYICCLSTDGVSFHLEELRPQWQQAALHTASSVLVCNVCTLPVICTNLSSIWVLLNFSMWFNILSDAIVSQVSPYFWLVVYLSKKGNKPSSASDVLCRAGTKEPRKLLETESRSFVAFWSWKEHCSVLVESALSCSGAYFLWGPASHCSLNAPKTHTSPVCMSHGKIVPSCVAAGEVWHRSRFSKTYPHHQSAHTPSDPVVRGFVCVCVWKQECVLIFRFKVPCFFFSTRALLLWTIRRSEVPFWWELDRVGDVWRMEPFVQTCKIFMHP